MAAGIRIVPTLDSIAPPYRPARPPFRAVLQELGTFLVREKRPAVSDRDLIPSGSQPPVLVIPALIRGDGHTRGLRAALIQAGYPAYGWDLGVDWGPTPKLLAGVEARFLALSDAMGPISLIGLSMGGLFCRWLACRHPARVRQVITVCTPFRAAVDSFWLPLRPLLPLWPLPDLEAMALRLENPLPVPGTFLYSPRDGIVAWESCLDRRFPDDCFAIDGSHVTISMDPSVRRIVLQRLGGVTPVNNDRNA